jgi:cell division protein FtsI (penicillin-binding protein 3)
MASSDKNIKKRLMLLGIPVLLVCASVWVKLVYVSVVEGPALRQKSNELVIREMAIPAKRGNIFSADQKMLATSMPVYDIYMDPLSPSQENFENNIAALAKELAKNYPHRNARQWENYLRGHRSKKHRYIEIATDQTFSQLQKVRAMPLLSLGTYKGGLIYHQINYRQQPIALAQRTIGYDENAAQAGIEGFFSAYLEGKEGHHMMQKIAGGHWKPLNDNNAIDPKDGLDIYTTINTRIQDVAHRALKKQLEKHQADHGSVIVMEVATGKIVAIANLGREKNGTYSEVRNYAVWESTEPGSTFKLASLMVALDDGLVDTAQIVDTEKGVYTVYGKQIKDSNVKNSHEGGYGKISVAEAFRLSSNTGIAKAVYGAYEKKPLEFVDQLYQIGLDKPTGITIKGETKPSIPKPGDAKWSGITLPWMTFGYQVSFTPLQMLALYNAIANDGVMVKPQIVNSIKKYGVNQKVFEVEVLNPAVCSKNTVSQLQALLRGVVTRGTATNLKSDKLTMAGKTGTCQLDYWKGERAYQSSFAGYFPAENPKYSCIVVVNKPNIATGFYGNIVAGPVFKAIAEEVYLSMPEPIAPTTGIASWSTNESATPEKALKNNYLPNLAGLTAMEAIALLENHGIRVQVSGSGKVKSQEPAIGTALRKNMVVKIQLG